MQNSSNRRTTDQTVIPTETTPLNHETFNNQSNSKMDADTKKVLTKIGIDVVLLCCGEFRFENSLKWNLIELSYNFSRISNLVLLPLRRSIRTRLLLRRRVTDPSVPRLNSHQRDALQHRPDRSNRFDHARRVLPLETQHGRASWSEAFRLRNSFLGAKRVQIRRIGLLWCCLLASDDRHRQIRDWKASTALHDPLHASLSWRHQLQRSNQSAQVHGSIHVRKPFDHAEKTQGNEIIVPQRSFELLHVHDGLCCSLPPRQV